MNNYTPSSLGLYGIFCEPKGSAYNEVCSSMRNPQWISTSKLSYEEAIKKADEMNRANKEWHYYAKPLD